MNTKKLILITIFISVLITSCQNGVNITLKNKSKIQIDSIILINDFKKIKIDNFKIDDSLSFYIDFNNSNHKGDGIFLLNIYENNETFSESFGYYSNGIPPAKDFIIDVYTEKIKINRIE